LEIIFIGTGSGKTSLLRNHSAFIINASKIKLLVDAGDGISKALLQSNINYNSINGIFITHFHPDHLSGLSSLLNQMKMNNRKESLIIYCPGNPDILKTYIETNLIFFDRLGFKLELIELNDDAEIKTNDEISFKVKQNSHLDKYIVNEKRHANNLISLSILFSLNGKKVFYTGDIDSAADLYLFKENYDIIISETTHINLSDLQIALESIKPEKVFLTHIDDVTETTLNLFLQSKSNLNQKISIAFDNFKWKI